MATPTSMTGLKTNIYHFSLFQLNQFLSVITSYVTISIVTRVLSAEEYGVYTNLTRFSEFLAIFFSFYISAAYTRYYYEYKTNKDSLATLTSSCFYFLLGLGILLYVPSLVGGNYFLTAINLDPQNYLPVLVVLIPLGNLFDSLASIGIAYLSQEKINVPINVISALKTLASVLAVLFFLLTLHLRENSLFYAAFLSSAINFLFGLYTLLKYKLLVRRFSISMLLACLKLSVASLPLVLSGWAYNFSDQIILSIYGSVSLSGKYALTYRVGQLIQFVYSSFFSVANPYLLNYLNDHTEKQHKELLRLINLGFFFLIISSLFLIFLGQHLLRLLAPAEFQLSPAILIMTVLAYIGIGIRKYTDSILWFHKRMWTMSILGIFPVVINLGLNLIFIPLFQEFAAAVTTLISALIIAIISVVVNSKIEAIPYDNKVTLVLLISLFSGLALVSFLIKTQQDTFVNLSLSFFGLIALAYLLIGGKKIFLLS